MSEQICHHMREAVPTGACYICQPSMFRFTPEQIEENWRRFRNRREPLVEVPVQARPMLDRRQEKPLPDYTPAPWQKLEQIELTILCTLAILGENPDFEGIEIGQLRRELGAAWPEAEVQHSLGQLRIKGYAGPYADGLWGIAGKGKAVIDDYKLRLRG